MNMANQEYDLIYRLNDQVERIAPKNGKKYQLAELQEIVGGWIQVCQGDDGNILIIDEEGKLKGKDLNERATQWYRTHVYRGDYIVGDALLCKEGRIE